MSSLAFAWVCFHYGKIMTEEPSWGRVASSSSPLDLLRVLVEALLQLAAVGGQPERDVVGVLLHHGLQLLDIAVHLLARLLHVLSQFVRQQLQVLAEALGALLGVGAQLVLQVVSVHGQLWHAVLDQSSGWWRRETVRGEKIKNPPALLH